MTPANFKRVSSRGYEWLECEEFRCIPRLIHAFTTRHAGAKQSSDAKGTTVALRPGKGGFLAALGAEVFRPAALEQRHTAIIYSVSADGHSSSLRYELSGYSSATAQGKTRPPIGDAFMTSAPEVALSVRVADCLPVLLADPQNGAIAAVHAGWRGALSRIIEKTAGEMRRVYRSRPEHLLAALGPSIRACCYEVGEEVIDAFRGRFACSEKFFRTAPADQGLVNRRFPLFFSQAPPGHRAEEHSGVYLDLAAVGRSQLEAAGVLPGHIYVADYCTACRTDLFYSYRKEGSRAGRMVALIGIRASSQGRQGGLAYGL